MTPRQIDISVEVQNVAYLLDLLQDELVDLNSDFQRSRDLWSPPRMSRFIESLIVSLPIPSFYLTTPEVIPASREIAYRWLTDYSVYQPYNASSSRTD